MENIVPQPTKRPKKLKSRPEKWRKNVIKKAKLAGQAHLGYKSELVPIKTQRPDEDCTCKTKCRDRFSLPEKVDHFNSYYGCGSNDEKVQYLRSLITKVGRKHRFFLKIDGQPRPVCVKFFLAIFDIRYSKLRKKVLNWSAPATDLRGKHRNRMTTTTAVMNRIRSFIMELEPRESHYSRSSNPNRTYLDSNESVAHLYRKFIELNPDLFPYSVLNEVQTQNRLEIVRVKPERFRHVFNEEFNIGFGFPRSDICEFCERNHMDQKRAAGDHAQIQRLKTEHDAHLREAEGFYSAMKAQEIAKLPSTTACLNFDYEKNLPLPVTNTSGEFYSRQLWIIIFGIHDMRSGKSNMFMYSESYAHKGANEVISCLDFYLKNCLPPNTQDLVLFCDNCPGQNKNRFLIAFLNSLNERFNSVRLHFPVPGHTRMPVDRDFAQTEKLRQRNDKFSKPSEYTRLVKEARPNQPFQVVYVEHPLTDDLTDDGTPVCSVRDFKSVLEPVMKPTPGIGKIRTLRFQADAKILASTSTLGTNEQDFTYIRNGSSLVRVKQVIATAPPAYDDYAGVTAIKATNVEKLLSFVNLPASCIFYSTMYRTSGPPPGRDFTSQSQLTNRGIADDEEDEDALGPLNP